MIISKSICKKDMDKINLHEGTILKSLVNETLDLILSEIDGVEIENDFNVLLGKILNIEPSVATKIRKIRNKK